MLKDVVPTIYRLTCELQRKNERDMDQPTKYSVAKTHRKDLRDCQRQISRKKTLRRLYAHRMIEVLRQYYARNLEARLMGGMMLPMPANRDLFIVRASDYGLE